LAIIKRSFDATVEGIQPEPRQLDNTYKKTAQFPDASPTFSSLETTITPATDTTSKLLYNVTFTGSTTTVLPFNLFPEHDKTSLNNNDDSNNNNNNNSQSIIYEGESCTLNSDENYLSTQDYDFVDSIQSPTFSGIFLPSLCYDSSKYSIFLMPSSYDEYNSVTASSDLTIIVHKSLSCQPISGATESLLVIKDKFNSRLSVYAFNLYVIFKWDPGIYCFM